MLRGPPRHSVELRRSETGPPSSPMIRPAIHSARRESIRSVRAARRAGA